jgi:tetratricopeptide (TPR) repeat protein
MDFLENRAEEAEEQGDLLVALGLWKELAERDKDPVFFCRYGRVAQTLERWDEAESAFAEALRLDTSFVLAMESMGGLWARRTDHEDSKSFETAKDWFLKALKCERKAYTLIFLGATYVALDDTEAARNAFEEAIQIEPCNEEALYNLAKLERVQNPQRATELLEKAIEIDPYYSIAHQEIGRLYHHAGDLVRAEYHFRNSLEADPTDYWLHMYLANLLAVQGKIVEAEQTYRFATSLHPENTGGTEIFAQFLDEIGKKAEAAIVRGRIKP